MKEAEKRKRIKTQEWCHRSQGRKERGVPVRSIRQEKTKNIQIKKEEVKLPVFTDNMTLYVEKPEDSTHKRSVRTKEVTVIGRDLGEG